MACETLVDEAANVADDCLRFWSLVGFDITASLEYGVDLSVTSITWLRQNTTSLYGIHQLHTQRHRVQVQVPVFIDTLAAQRPNNLIKIEKV